MERGRNAQYGALSGVVAVVLIFVGFVIFASDIPSSDDAAQKWQAFFVDHQDRIQTGLTLISIGAFFFIWFLGSLRDAIAGSEPGSRLASIAFGGGLVGLAILSAGTAGGLTAALHPQGYDPNLLRSWADFGALAGAPAAAGFTAMFTATAIAGYRHGALPAPIAGIAATAAIGQAFAFFAGTSDQGVFAPDGALGAGIPFVTFVIGILALSITLYRRAGREVAVTTT
jgi:hypothetical protein